MQKTSSQKAKVVAAKIPATTESEIEVSPSATASELSTQVASQIRGEECSADFGGPPRLTLVAALSGLAEVIPPGHWALNNGIGAPVNLGAQIQILPLAASRAWLLDFGQEEGGGVPVRFEHERDVEAYGGTTTRAPGKPTFSRSMEIRLLLPDTEQADSTYLRIPLNAKIYLAALYEASRTAYRSVGVGLNLHWHNTKELPHKRRWQLGVTTRKSKTVNAAYHLPILSDLGVVPDAEIGEIEKLIDRGLLD
jgi:hypothetical protein